MTARAPSGLDVAIIGMVCRLPGAHDPEQFWANLMGRVESISRFTPEELRAAGVPPEVSAAPGYVAAGGVLDAVDRFDAAFFGIPPREAELMDPQQRLFLESAWELMEQVGHDAGQYPGAVGVYAGTGMPAYFLEQLHRPGEIPGPVEGYQMLFGNNKDHLTTRTCYKLELTGPGVTVQTACSTGLVAVHLAARALLGGECDLALAGAVSLRIPQHAGYFGDAGGIVSPDGRCRPFAADANGTVFGSGLGIVALKRLEDAVADGDRIRAVLRATAVNNDGGTKVAYPAPSLLAQAQVIRMAHRLAEVGPDEIAFVEAHGTGTPLGDPIEVAALTEAFRAGTDRRGFCALGSVKGNLGHLDTAAGMAGLIKAVLALEHRVLPPTVNVDRPNPDLRLADSPFFLPTDAVSWPADQDRPLLAGVSSFGMGGTNAHAVLSEWTDPEAMTPDPARPTIEARALEPAWQLVQLSARTAPALEAAADRLATALAAGSTDLADACHTLRVGRRAFTHRLVLSARDAADAAAGLRAPGRVRTGVVAGETPAVAFLFPGQGTQRPGLAAGLYRSRPAFRRAVDDCADRFGGTLADAVRTAVRADGEVDLDHTEIAQPVLFVVEYALAALWRSVGVEPVAMIGHSLGEYVAACVSGALPLDDALRLVAARGRLLAELPAGRMLAVGLPVAEVEATLAQLGRPLDLAAVNGPASCVVSGPAPAVGELRRMLAARGIHTRELRTRWAFHSAMMEPAMAALSRAAAGIRPGLPTIPYTSNLTGTWMTPQLLADPEYWARHLRATVRFAAGLDAVVRATSGCLFLEVGPGQALAGPARATGRPVVSSLGRAGDDDVLCFGEAAGRLWLAGVRLDSEGMRAGGRRVPLPTYPFERASYWARRAPAATPAPGSTEAVPGDAAPAYSLRPDSTPAGGPRSGGRGRRADAASWFAVPVWSQTVPVPPVTTRPPRRFLILLDDGGFGARLVSRLEAAGQYVTAASRAEADGILVDVDVDTCLVHLHALDDPDGTSAAGSLAGVAARLPAGGELVAVTTGAVEVTGAEPANPGQAALLGPCLAAAHEIPDARCRLVDIDLTGPDPAGLLAAELVAGPAAPDGMLIAHRAGRRWRRTFAPMQLDAEPTVADGAAYAIIGGTGALGGALAAYLARHAHARLALIARAPLPAGDRRLADLVALGAADVVSLSADATDPAALGAALDAAVTRLGPLTGVILTAGGRLRRRLGQLPSDLFARHVTDRVRMAQALAAVTDGRPVGHCAVVSSLAAVVGGAGLGAYAAAHAVVDELCVRHWRAGRPWVTVDCDHWLVGDHDRDRAPAPDTGPGPGAGAPFMTGDEGCVAFLRAALLAGVPQVVVSTRDLDARMPGRGPARTGPPPPSPATASGSMDDIGSGVAGGNRHPRPDLPIPFTAPRTAAERAIAALWARQLGLERVGVFDNFFDLGGDSLIAIQLISSANQLGLRLSMQELLARQTVAELAEAADDGWDGGAAGDAGELPGSPPTAVDGPVSGPAPLTPAQRAFLDPDPVDPTWYDHTICLDVAQPLDLELLRTAVAALLVQHDGLRARFHRTKHGWEQTLAPPGEPVPVRRVELSGVRAEDDVADHIRAATATARDGFDLAAGPLFAVVLLSGYRADRLLLIAHHLLVDAVSWRILLNDLLLAYQQAAAGLPVVLPPRSTSVAEWGRHLTGVTPALRDEIHYWTDPVRHRAASLTPDGPAGPDVVAGPDEDLVADTRTVTTWLDRAETGLLLRDLPRRHGVGPADVTLAAVVRAIRAGSAEPALLVDIEGMGRHPAPDGVDLSRTVGWLTAIHPVPLSTDADDLLDAARGVARQLAAVPRGGLGYGVLRWSAGAGGAQSPSDDDSGELAARLAVMPRAPVSFVYLGSVDPGLLPGGLVSVSTAAGGVSRSPRAPRDRPLDIAAIVADGRLGIEWRSGQRVLGDGTVARIAEAAAAELRALAAALGRSPAAVPPAEVVGPAGSDPAGLDSPHAAVPPDPGGRSVPRQPGGPPAWSPVVPLAGGTGQPLFCVHPAGGSVLAFRALARSLGDRPFHGIQGRGLAPGERPDDRVGDMADRYLPAVRAVQPVGPYLIGGWSFGGTVAFELALRLQAAGEDVSLLLIDSRPPHGERPGQLPPERELRAIFTSGAASLRDHLGRAGELGSPAEPDPNLLERAYVVWRAHLEALVTYAPRATYEGAVTLLTAAEEAPALMSVLGPRGAPMRAGWAAVSTTAPIVREVPGSHFTLVAPPHVHAVADAIRELLPPRPAPTGPDRP